MNAPLICTMASHQITRLSIDLPARAPGSRPPALVLIGHSAIGKSALLEALGLDRSNCDMDIVLQATKAPATVDSLKEMVRNGRSPLYVAANHVSLLNMIFEEKKKGNLNELHFIYLRRPLDIAYKYFALPNTDGRHHPPYARDEYEILYATFDHKFALIADTVVEFQGPDILVLKEFFSELVVEPGTKESEPARQPASTPARQNGDAGGSAHDPAFKDYDVMVGGPTPKILDEDEMRRITAGGYQVFDANQFPPVPNVRSICHKKLADLKWANNQFDGRSVMEIGCQLGFFTFTALARGAREVVGFDIEPRFVQAANAIAVNYKKNVCKWPNDRARFAVRRFAPGDILPFKPDILVANSIIHWWIIQNPSLSLHDVIYWLHEQVNEALYFEGCVTAEEEIMIKNGVDISRYNEDLFMRVCSDVFHRVDFIDRCSYDSRRIVCRLYK